MTAVILAAGQGTRMKSDLLKVLHPIMGKPMLGHVVDNVRAAGVDRIIVVVGFQQEKVWAYLGGTVSYAEQAERLGTGHALMQTEPLLRELHGDILLLNGDNPLIGFDVLQDLIRLHRGSNSAATVLTAEPAQPAGFGRVVRAPDGSVARIVEEKDASPTDNDIREVNAGVYCLRLSGLFDLLRRISPNNAQGEYYVTDLVGVLKADGEKVSALKADDPTIMLAPNDRRQMADAERVLRLRVLDRLMVAGVTVVDPATTYVDPAAKIGRDTTIWPYTRIEGPVVVGEASTVGPFAILRRRGLGAD